MNKDLEELIAICTDDSDRVPTAIQWAIFRMYDGEANEEEADVAASELAKKDAEVTALRLENDKLTEQVANRDTLIQAMHSDNARLTERVKALEVALKPFADAYNNVYHEYADGESLDGFDEVYVRHLSAAAALLERKP